MVLLTKAVETAENIYENEVTDPYLGISVVVR